MISSTSAPRRLTDLWSWLPRGQHLSDGVWRGRHRFLQVLLWLHVPFLSAMGIANGEEVWHTMSEVGLVATLALFSHLLEGRAVRASVVAAGLLSCSAILVHFTGGLIESHFHFFAVLLLISFYQDWRPFVMGVLWVVVHHGVVGSLYPTQVYNHPAALARPVLWAVIHALYVLGLVIALVVYWWFMEVAQREVAAAQVQQRLAEEKSERLQEERARQAEIGRMKDQFIASVSHELRTPLTAVVGFAELLRHEGWDLDEEDRRSMVDSLAREALDVASLVEDLLVAARSAAGELSVHRVPVSLREQAAQVLEGLEGLGTGHIQLVAPPGEEVRCCADPARVRQILRNLVTNALRYGGDQVHITIENVGDTSRVSVWDNGPGVPENARERSSKPTSGPTSQKRNRAPWVWDWPWLASSPG